MRQKLFAVLFFGAFFILLFNKGNASHLVGADITYTCLGGNSYKFTLTVYRDCASGALLEPTYKIDYSSTSCALQGSFTVAKIAGTGLEISPVCPSVPSTCTGGTSPGIQKFVYEGNVTLPKACTDWVFGFKECNRNASINTISNPGNQCLYIEARINNVAAPCNSSPKFTNDPVAFICIDQNVQVNPGAVDPNGDVLRYTTVTPKTSNITNVTYTSPFTTASPLSTSSGFTTNTNTGDITLRPTVNGQRTVTALRVEEYRNNQLIGSVMRDLQLIVINCNNSLPTLSGVNGTTNYTFSICANTSACFNIYAKDSDSLSQTMTMTWNAAIAGASFTTSGPANSPDGRFCWSPTSANVGSKTFTVTVEDNACPITGSQTYSYTINVLPSPTASLRSDTTIACSATIPLTTTVVGGTSPFTYQWNTGETTQTVNKSTGFYKVTVTDSRGCTGKDSVNLNSGIIAAFNHPPACAGRPVTFTDISFSNGIKNSWVWNFGDNTPNSTQQNPQHIFATAGTYNVTLTVGDNLTCSESVTMPITVCEIPVAGFSVSNKCEGETIIFTDSSTKTCNITNWIYSFGDGATQVFTASPAGHVYSMEGTYNVTLIVNNSNGCADTVSKTVVILDRPTADIIETNYYLPCNDPDTVLHGAYSDGKPPYTFLWSTGSTTTSSPASGVGTFGFTVTDSNGCMHSDVMAILDPLAVSFTSTAYCNAADQITFTRTGFSAWPIVSYDWDFGDGTPHSSLPGPTHTYAQEKLYNVKLTLTDSTGCSESSTNRVIIMLPDDYFTVTEDTACYGTALTIYGPKGPFINSWLMSFGDGSGGLANNFPYGDTVFNYSHAQWTHTYNNAGDNPVTLTVSYNDGQCTKIFDTIIHIHPQLAFNFTNSNPCAASLTSFTFNQTSGDPIALYNWNFGDGSPTSNIPNPTHTYSLSGSGAVFYNVSLGIQDIHGCPGLRNQAIRMSEVGQPCLDKTGNCLNESFVFYALGTCDSFENWASHHWEFGDGSVSNLESPFHQYSAPGDYLVKMVVSSSEGCKDSSTTNVIVLPIPEANFTYDTVCLGMPTSFNSELSLPVPGDSLTAWQWDFGDGTNSIIPNPTHAYSSSGYFPVNLVVFSSNGCRDTLTNDSTLVMDIPQAGFYSDPAEFYAFSPVTFQDQSSNAISWQYNFGDGDTSHQSSPTHTYNVVSVYTVEQIVTNALGCSDTASNIYDLTPHLIVPNAFTPNGDNTNDKFDLIYRGITNLLEFKVFNRWGEVVFEGSGDLTSFWDGTFRGEDQPVGVYVYYVVGRTIYGNDIILKGNLTLLR